MYLRTPARIAVAVALALGGLTACGDDKPAETAASETASFNDADVMFAQMMIPHHEQAVEMAKLAATRAKDPRVKKLAAAIAAGQQPEIDTMTGWLTSWNKPRSGGAMAGMKMSGMADAAAMKKLRAASGAAFDQQFLTLMLAHHQGAIEMARTEMASGKFDAALSMASDIEKAQSQEVALMKRLREG